MHRSRAAFGLLERFFAALSDDNRLLLVRVCEYLIWRSVRYYTFGKAKFSTVTHWICDLRFAMKVFDVTRAWFYLKWKVVGKLPQVFIFSFFFHTKKPVITQLDGTDFLLCLNLKAWRMCLHLVIQISPMLIENLNVYSIHTNMIKHVFVQRNKSDKFALMSTGKWFHLFFVPPLISNKRRALWMTN